MLLAIDVGNTNITLGLYQGESRLGAWRLATVHNRMPDEYGLQMLGLLEHARHTVQEIDGTVLASVVPPLTGTFVQACREYLSQDPLVVDAGVKTGLSVRYEDPKHALGADRVADAVAVNQLYGTPACVVDFGTATTFDALSRSGEYLGGAIAPGIDVAAESLFLRTAKLPRVELDSAAWGDRPQHGQRHPIRVDLRLRGAGGGDGGSLQAGTGGRHPGHRDGRPAEPDCGRDAGHPAPGPLADFGRAAADLGDESLIPCAVPIFISGSFTWCGGAPTWPFGWRCGRVPGFPPSVWGPPG